MDRSYPCTITFLLSSEYCAWHYSTHVYVGIVVGSIRQVDRIRFVALRCNSFEAMRFLHSSSVLLIYIVAYAPSILSFWTYSTKKLALDTTTTLAS